MKHPFSHAAVGFLVSIWLVGLLLFAGAAACSALPPLAQAPVQTGQPSTLGGDVTITPRQVEPAEWAEILDIERWKFDVDVGPDTELHYQLEVRLPDEAPLTLAGFSVFTSGSFDGDTLIALYPVADDFYHADELKYHIRSGGASTARTFENPFQGWAALKPHQPPVLLQSGTYELIVFSRVGTFPDRDNAQVVLVLSTAGTDQ